MHSVVSARLAAAALPIVMVPGFLCTTKFFEKNAEVLSKEFRVITMDPRGQGNSSKTCQGNTIRRNAQDIACSCGSSEHSIA